MIWAVRDRATFRAFRLDGIRGRHGPLGITFLPPTDGPNTPPRVAFAITRRVGHAVGRNRLRRRLRNVLSEMVPDRLPAGSYLVWAGIEAVEMSSDELREHVKRALERIEQHIAASPAPKGNR